MHKIYKTYIKRRVLMKRSFVIISYEQLRNKDHIQSKGKTKPKKKKKSKTGH